LQGQEEGLSELCKGPYEVFQGQEEGQDAQGKLNWPPGEDLDILRFLYKAFQTTSKGFSKTFYRAFKGLSKAFKGALKGLQKGSYEACEGPYRAFERLL